MSQEPRFLANDLLRKRSENACEDIFLGRLALRLLPGCRLKLMPNAVSGVNKGWQPQKAASLDAADADY